MLVAVDQIIFNILADACLLALGGQLILIGGAKAKYRYADEPSKVWVKRRDRPWQDDALPDLLAARMWQACTVANVDGEVR